jgi:hypothetical protein
LLVRDKGIHPGYLSICQTPESVGLVNVSGDHIPQNINVLVGVFGAVQD